MFHLQLYAVTKCCVVCKHTTREAAAYVAHFILEKKPFLFGLVCMRVFYIFPEITNLTTWRDMVKVAYNLCT